MKTISWLVAQAIPVFCKRIGLWVSILACSFSWGCATRHTGPVSILQGVPGPKILPTASIVLGAKNQEHGIVLRAKDDGLNEPAVMEGKGCRGIVHRAPHKPAFLYFAIDPKLKKSDLMKAQVTVEYFDAAPGHFHMEYDSGDFEGRKHPAYKHSLEDPHLTGSMSWKQATFYLPDARFRNAENGRSDFRIAGEAPKFYVRSVMVTLEE